MIKISIQEQDFNVDKEYQEIKNFSSQAGAIVQFTGLVRADNTDKGQVEALTLEHYPGMTEAAIEDIIQQAKLRWPILATTVIHRVGKLLSQDNIVLVVVAAQHRAAAFEAASYIMDYLKNDVPLWKKQSINNTSSWVEQKDSDKKRKKLWQ